MIQEIILSILLIFLIVPLINGAYFAMSEAMVMTVDIGLVVVFALAVVFIWRERVRDEREKIHRMSADRLGFLVGSGVLVFFIVLQSFRHKLDLYLPITLLLMVLAKITGRIWSKYRQ